MSITGREIIRRALKQIGAVAQGETPSASDVSDGLATLKSMIDSWSTDGLLVFERKRTAFTLVPGQASYTVGPSGANFTTSPSRPVKLDAASIEIQDTSLWESPVEIIQSPEEWALVSPKNLQVDIPYKLYAANTEPNDTYYVWPVPASANKLVLYYWTTLSQFTEAGTELTLAPGYEDALIFNLAVRLAPEYNRPVSAETAKLADDSKAQIMRANFRPTVLRCDDAILQRNPPYNIWKGPF